MREIGRRSAGRLGSGGWRVVVVMKLILEMGMAMKVVMGMGMGMVGIEETVSLKARSDKP